MFHPQTVIRLTHLWCGVVVLTSIGCQTYSPYGYGSYPGNYGSPVYQQPGQPVPYGSPGMAPGTTIMPPAQGGYPPPGMQGGYPPPGNFPGGDPNAPAFAPGPVTPATPYPNVPNGPLPQGADGSGGAFGPPGTFPDAGAKRPPADGRMVPNYIDADEFSSPNRAPVTTPGIEDEANFKGNINGGGRAATRLKNMETETGVRPGAALTSPTGDDIQFSPGANPTVPRTAKRGIIQTAQHVEAAPQTQQLSPYGRAPNGAWFRGLIDYDEEEKLWYMIYNPEPDANDPQGGIVTLAEHPHLNLLQGDDVVLVEGGFDHNELDSKGRPKYRPEFVRRLIP